MRDCKRVILHIMPHEKWAAQIMDSNERNFSELEHRYYLYTLNKEMEDKVEKVDNHYNIIWATKQTTIQQGISLIKEIIKSDVIIFHSLFLPTWMLFLTDILGVVNRKKYNWVVWGGDIYNELWRFRSNPMKPKIFIRELARKWFIACIPEILSLYGDYKYIKQNYYTRGNQFWAQYQLPMIDKSLLGKKKQNEGVNILIGNNASPTNNHIEAMKRIKKYVGENDKIYIILSYPKISIKYKKELLRTGKKLFGKNFLPIEDFIPYNEYINFLNDIDIAVMNQNRQQGGSNIVNLIYMGKKVYLNTENTYYGDLKRMKVNIYSMKEIDNTFSEKLSDNLRIKNEIIMGNFMSDNEYRKRWHKVYYK